MRVHVHINVRMTASDDARHGEERGEAKLPLVRCRCHIGSVRSLHRQAAAHSRGNDTALLLWGTRDGILRGRGGARFSFVMTS